MLTLTEDATSSDIVLTAAHCVTKCEREMIGPKDNCSLTNKKMDADKLTIIAGNHYQNIKDEGERVVVASSLEIYPTWTPDWRTPVDDIAVVKLSEKIEFTKTIQPARLPKSGESVKKAKNCVVAGWGYTTAANQEKKQQTSELYAVNVSKIYDDDKCGGGQYMIPRSQRGRTFCAEAESRVATACEGDSGSPLWCSSEDKDRPVVYGVVSAGPKVCGHNKAGAFGAVSAYVEWINEAIARLNRNELN